MSDGSQKHRSQDIDFITTLHMNPLPPNIGVLAKTTFSKLTRWQHTLVDSLLGIYMFHRMIHVLVLVRAACKRSQISADLYTWSGILQAKQEI